MATYTNFRWGLTGESQTLKIEDGRVLSRGPAQPHDCGEDLNGAWLMPAFVDNHCHILPTGLDLQKLHLGKCDTHEQVLDAVRDRLNDTPAGAWLHAVHYDQTRYEEGRHLTRDDLDAISTTVPILLRHVNGHASVANTAALFAAKIREDEADPSGGEFQRDACGRLTGVLFEAAHEKVTAASPKPTLDEMVDAILRAGESMASFGIGTAADMMAGRFDLLQEMQAYRLASERGCPIRLRLYIQWAELFGPRAHEGAALKEAQVAMNPERCRIAGVKIFADGAIGSATAAIYGSYTGQPAKGPVISRRAQDAVSRDGREVSGQLIYAPEKLNQMVRIAHEAGYSIAFHSIGDYSTDLVMDAIEQTDEPSRHRIEHAMMLSDAQIARLAKLNPSVSMQPEFLMRFGHSYKRQLGEERAATLKRMRSVKDAGLRLSLSSDRPIVAGDPWDGVLTATDRPEGFIPDENLTREEALRGYTRDGALALGDEDLGSLDPDQQAHFTVWDQNPLECTAKPKLLQTYFSENRPIARNFS